MGDYVGQRLTTGASDTLPGSYVRVPAAASAMVRDGRAIDAAAAMIIQSNLSHLASESERHLFYDVKGGTLSQIDGWSGLVDARDDDTSEISYAPTVAFRYGPIFAIEDRANAEGLPVQRDVVIEVEAKSGTTDTLTIYLALVAGLDPQVPYLGAVAETNYHPGTSLAVTAKTLSVPRPSPASTPMRCRPATSATGAAESIVVPYWVWVGYRSTDSGDRLLTISGYEQRS